MSSPTTLVNTVTGIPGATGLACSSTTVYVVGNNTTNLYRLELVGSTLTAVVVTNLGYACRYMVYYNNCLYITVWNPSALIKYDIVNNTIVTLDLSSIGVGCSGIAINNNILYVSIWGAKKVLTVNPSTMTIINNIYLSLPINPSCMTFDSSNNLYITSAEYVYKYNSNENLVLYFTIVPYIYGITYNSGYLFLTTSVNCIYIYEDLINPNVNVMLTEPSLYTNINGGYQSIFFNNQFYVASFTENSVNVYNYTMPCFYKNAKILCLINDEEQYVPVSELKKGDYVKTYKHGFKKIELIGSRNILGNNDDNDEKNSLYKCKYTEDGLDNLIITGLHSIIVDNTSDVERERQRGLTRTFEDKQLLLAMASDDFEKLEREPDEIYTVYHFVLEDSDEAELSRFGVWANGILAETCDKKLFLKHFG